MSLLNERQQALSDFMSEISEEAFYASWMEDLEYVLWYSIQYGPANYGHKFVDEQTILHLKHLSKEADSWIVFDDDTWETAVTLPTGEEMFRIVSPNRYLKYYPHLYNRPAF